MAETLLVNSIIQENLEKTYSRSSRVKIDNNSKIIVLSDFHLGSGKSRDEFKKNARLVMIALKEWYLPRGYTLILNGDIEELHRLKLPTISQTWEELYKVFLEFKKGPGLYKIQGNHDSGHSFRFKGGRSDAELEVNSDMIQSIILEYEDNEILVLHGHQASLYNSPFRYKFNKFLLRYLAHPLHINNIKRDFLSDKPLKAEQRIFDFARKKGIVVLAGHTHRALFEGHSEEEYLKIKIDQMIRDYMNEEPDNRDELHESILNTTKVLQKLLETEDYKSRGSIYDPLALACLFNSGTVIHRFGATGLEIKGGKIYLNAWFDKTNPQSKVFMFDPNTSPLKEHPWIQNYTLKSDDLSYIFTRLRLLTDTKFRNTGKSIAEDPVLI